MRIFKNRGDIYFSKVNKERSAEQKILLTALVVILIFTVVFVIAVSAVNDFSAKKFFAPEQTTAANNIAREETVRLPQVSGKKNFLFSVYEDETLLFVTAVQVDLDGSAYKVCSFKANTVLDGSSLMDLFKNSGIQNVKSAISVALGTDFDYGISMEADDYEELFNTLGSINYPILNDIKYREEKSPVSYSIKISAGEQTIDGKRFVNLIRYYLDSENNPSQANELMLAALSQQINSENYGNSEELFKSYIATADTDITVRDFSSAGDELQVISSDQKNMGVYNARAEYDGNSISESSMKKIKGYFVK
ncbi:MAG: hypothetical protein ACI4IR_08850 [Eubacterium sp.]